MLSQEPLKAILITTNRVPPVFPGVLENTSASQLRTCHAPAGAGRWGGAGLVGRAGVSSPAAGSSQSCPATVSTCCCPWSSLPPSRCFSHGGLVGQEREGTQGEQTRLHPCLGRRAPQCLGARRQHRSPPAEVQGRESCRRAWLVHPTHRMRRRGRSGWDHVDLWGPSLSGGEGMPSPTLHMSIPATPLPAAAVGLETHSVRSGSPQATRCQLLWEDEEDFQASAGLAAWESASQPEC